MLGTARYSSRWRSEFQAKLATRSPGRTPSSVSADGDPPRALDDPAVGGALDPGLCPRDDLALGEHPLGPLGDLLDEERPIHHQPVHPLTVLRSAHAGRECRSRGRAFGPMPPQASASAVSRCRASPVIW